MLDHTYQKPYAQLNPDQLVRECQAAGLPVIDVLTVGEDPNFPPESIIVRTSRELTPTEKTTLDNVVSAHDGRPKRVRPIVAIYQQLATLTNIQQDAIIADLQLTNLSGKWSSMMPPQDAPAAVVRQVATDVGGVTQAERRRMAGWMVAMWCQQNPKYLVNPTFHASLSGVNIPGDELAT